MSDHSLLVGGSIAERRIRCPASFTEQLKAPPAPASDYAEHGTAMHEAMAHWLQNPDDDLVGQIFNGHEITQTDIDALLEPAWNSMVALQEQHGGAFKVTHLEKRVAFPGMVGAFGTVDIVLESATHFIIADYKFGRGVFVPITRPDGDLNAQLLFYLAGIKRLVKKRQMAIAIIQPAFPPGLAHAPVSSAQLTTFERTLHKAVALATAADPPRARGEWCRFAPCKATCCLFTGPLLDLSALGKPPPAPSPQSLAWGVYLAAAKRLTDSALQFQKQINSALIEHLRQGGAAPGFALKLSAKNRKWLDDQEFVGEELEQLGLYPDDIWRRTLQTFTVVDNAAKRLGVEVPDHLRPRPPATDFVLTDVNDPAAVDPQALTAEFTAALRAIANEQEMKAS